MLSYHGLMNGNQMLMNLGAALFPLSRELRLRFRSEIVR
jgi:hypothetical protein